MTDRGRRLDLDGLRAVAVALVVLDHAQWPRPGEYGLAGVTAFFVISGYVITGVLRKGDPLRVFYARRALRLLPALGVVMLAVLALGLASPASAACTALYAANWCWLAGVPMRALGHAWSLSIEEQFYLVWPLLLIVSGRRAPWAAAALLAVGLASQALLTGYASYFSTLAAVDGLAAGCLLALVPVRLPRQAGIVGLALLPVAAMLSGTAGIGGLPQVLAVLGASLVVAGPVPALGRLAPAGRRAYSVYLWSWPTTVALGPGLAATLATLALAEASWRLVEMPCARIRARIEAGWRPQPLAEAAG